MKRLNIILAFWLYDWFMKSSYYYSTVVKNSLLSMWYKINSIIKSIHTNLLMIDIAKLIQHVSVVRDDNKAS